MEDGSNPRKRPLRDLSALRVRNLFRFLQSFLIQMDAHGKIGETAQKATAFDVHAVAKRRVPGSSTSIARI